MTYIPAAMTPRKQQQYRVSLTTATAATYLQLSTHALQIKQGHRMWHFVLVLCMDDDVRQRDVSARSQRSGNVAFRLQYSKSATCGYSRVRLSALAPAKSYWSTRIEQWRTYPLALGSQDPDKNSEFYRTLQRILIEDPVA